MHSSSLNLGKQQLSEETLLQMTAFRSAPSLTFSRSSGALATPSKALATHPCCCGENRKGKIPPSAFCFLFFSPPQTTVSSGGRKKKGLPVEIRTELAGRFACKQPRGSTVLLLLLLLLTTVCCFSPKLVRILCA